MRRPWTLNLKCTGNIFTLPAGFLDNSVWLNCSGKELTSFPPAFAWVSLLQPHSCLGAFALAAPLSRHHRHRHHPCAPDYSTAAPMFHFLHTDHLLRDLPGCSLSRSPALYFFIAPDSVLYIYLICSLWFVFSTRTYVSRGQKPHVFWGPICPQRLQYTLFHSRASRNIS